MKKKVIIRSGTLKMGGLERVLIEVLQSIEENKYDLTLFIENDAGEENVFLKDVPKWIKVYFLKPESIMRKAEFYRENRKKFFYRIMYNYTMAMEKHIVIKNTKKYLEIVGEPDVFIDYDSGATKYIEKLNLKKTLVWLHSSVEKLIKSQSKLKRFGKRLEKYTKVVSICDEMKEEVERLYPYLKGKVERVYNPFNFERILPLGEDSSLLTKEQKEMIESGYCLAVSRLDNVQKDYPTLIKAFNLLKERGIDQKLFIIGEGPGRGEIEELIKKYSLEENIKLLGSTKNPYIWMKNSDFFVHSSKYEGFGLVLIEAAIFGKTIISSKCQVGPQEILQNGDSGFLFEVGNYEELANILEKCIKDKELLKNYGEKAKVRALDFDKNKIIEEYYKLI